MLLVSFWVWHFKSTLFHEEKKKKHSNSATAENNGIILMLWWHWNCFNCWLGRIFKKFSFPTWFYTIEYIGVYLGDVPATNVFKYDETNLKVDVVDAVCRSWMFVGRGRKSRKCKRHEQNANFGDGLPPMVVYKAEGLQHGRVRVDYKVLFMTATRLDSLTQTSLKSSFSKHFWEKVK